MFLSLNLQSLLFDGRRTRAFLREKTRGLLGEKAWFDVVDLCWEPKSGNSDSLKQIGEALRGLRGCPPQLWGLLLDTGLIEMGRLPRKPNWECGAPPANPRPLNDHALQGNALQKMVSEVSGSEGMEITDLVRQHQIGIV